MQPTIIPVTEYNSKMSNRFNMTFHNNQGKMYKRGYVVEHNGNAAYFQTLASAEHFAKNPIIDIQEGSTPESRMNS